MFSDKLKELRCQKNLSQEDLAEILNISRTAVSKWERGKGLPNIEALKAIGKYFSVSVDYLLNEESSAGEKKTLKKTLCVTPLIDCAMIFFLILPLFPKEIDGHFYCTMIFNAGFSLTPKILYSTLFFISLLCGIIHLVLENISAGTKLLWFSKIASFSVGMMLLFTVVVTPQTYADVFILVMQVLKFILLVLSKNTVTPKVSCR